MVGRRARCAACDAAFTVPVPTAEQNKTPAPVEKKEETENEAEQYIGFECRVCGTRMYGRSDQEGKKLECPDCGARTVVPPPPTPKAKNMPAALEGEQYELWGVDEQPLPSQLIASQPKYIAVTCRVCGTLMQATELQVGRSVRCPDCGTPHVVPPKAKPAAVRSVLAPDSQTPKLDPAAHPGEVPAHAPSSHRLFHEEKREAEYAAALEKSQRTGKPMELDSRGRPVLPRFPLVSGILGFPFTAGCWQRWIALTLGLLGSAGLMVDGIPGWLLWNGDAAGAKAAFGGLIETIIGATFLIIWVAAASNFFIAIVSHSAVGAKRIEEWPSMNFIGSMGEMLPVIVAVIFGAAPGYMLGRLVGGDWIQLGLFGGCSLLLIFPIVHLSQLAGGATWELIDLGVMSAAFRCPFSMMLFYIQSASLGAICVAATVALSQINLYLLLAAAPLYVGCLIIYARLLGRLAWRLSEKMPVELSDEDGDDVRRAKNMALPR